MFVLFPSVPATAVLAGTLLFNSLVAPPTTLNYEFGNGSVQIDTPMEFRGMALAEPKLLGAGGGGSVWKMRANRKNQDIDSKNDVVVKISWSRSTNSVRNECEVLNVMQRYGVTGVERCLGAIEYKYDPRRVVIAMEPFVEDIDTNNDGGDITSSLEDLSPSIARRSAIQLSKTMAQMISANVVTSDIQPLISKSTGKVILIDMTEAKAFQPDRVITEIDKALINAFCTEMIGLIPDDLLDEATKSFQEELRRIESESHVVLREEFREVLRDLPLKGVEKLP
mmetsp:Transcript_20213/g.50283  ORF Transcript_20213/g.50283 Transcript_20213/m.50283 type:complete len:282 (+) Transcript_20213:66-911(+)